jgi:hypothetical protein
MNAETSCRNFASHAIDQDLLPWQFHTTCRNSSDVCSTSKLMSHSFFTLAIWMHHACVCPRDWMNVYKGQSKLCLRPNTTEQVASILSYANGRNLAVVPQVIWPHK